MSDDKDKIERERIRVELAARKKAKSYARISKLLAKKSGETKKMPLTDKAAWRFIMEGK